MLEHYNSSEVPLYEPKGKIKRYIDNEHFDYLTIRALKKGVLYSDRRPLPDLGVDIEWKRPKEICKRPYLIKDYPDRFDALQGKLGDCWFVIAMEALTFHKELFEFVVPGDQSFDYNYTGAFHFRFFQLGTWYDVVVDDRLPVFKSKKKLCYAHSKSGDVFWAALLEKAYSKFNSGKRIHYDSLIWGVANTSFQELTGGITERIRISNPPPGRPLKWFLDQVFRKGASAACMFNKKPQDGAELYPKHFYYISGIFYNEDTDSDYPGLCLVRLMNPYGHSEWSWDWYDGDFDNWRTIDKEIQKEMNFKIEDDGEFWMNVEDFEKYFTFLFVCHMGPGQYYYCHTRSSILTWSTKAFVYEWVAEVSAGGPSLSKQYMNPQFKIKLDLPDYSNNDTVIVVIELTQRSIANRHFRPKIGFYIYHLTDEKDQNCFLTDDDFFDQNKPINESNLTKSDGCTNVDSFDLIPGYYCIVPYTAEENQETSFLLRIFTESDINEWVYDTSISKSASIAEDPNEILNYEALKHYFEEAAQNKQVDRIGLKHILEQVMNPNGNNGTLTSVLRRTSNALARSFSTRTSKYGGNGYIEFSKDECRSMIAMLDQDNSGQLDYFKLCNLWKTIILFCKVYDSFKDDEGCMQVNKLRTALGSIGFNLNKQVIHSLVHFYANEKSQISIKDFILCGVILETFFTSHGKDKPSSGLNYSLEEWVKNVLCV